MAVARYARVAMTGKGLSAQDRSAWERLAQDRLAQDRLAQDRLAQDMSAQDISVLNTVKPPKGEGFCRCLSVLSRPAALLGSPRRYNIQGLAVGRGPERRTPTLKHSVGEEHLAYRAFRTLNSLYAVRSDRLPDLDRSASRAVCIEGRPAVGFTQGVDPRNRQPRRQRRRTIRFDNASDIRRRSVLQCLSTAVSALRRSALKPRHGGRGTSRNLVADGDAIRLDAPRTSEWAARSGDGRHVVAAIARSDRKGVECIAAGDRRRNDTGTIAEWRRSLGTGRVLR
jgi:hypothetical protein